MNSLPSFSAYERSSVRCALRRFFRGQVLVSGKQFWSWTRWGRLGEPGQSALLVAAYTIELALECAPRPGAAVSCRDAPEDVQILVGVLNGPGFDLMAGAEIYRMAS